MTTPTVLLRWILIYLLPVVLFAWFYQARRPGTYSSLSLSSIRHFLTVSDGGISVGDVEEEKGPLLKDYREDQYDWKTLIKMIPSGTTTIVDQDGVENGNVTGKNDSGTTINVVHIIVLVHGWLGNSLEMNSIKESLEASASTSSSTTTSELRPKEQTRQIHQFVIHSATSNEGRTNDGIQAGGRRLAREINSLVDFVAHHEDSPALVTLSLVGNSLGGLYARHALADIDFSNPIVRPLLFVTTATPHLGVSQHTYLPLPRAVEYPIAWAMDRTGRDLFRFTSTLEELMSEEKYLTPLLRFHSRIAYVNVYGTDFQVPTPTAGFWTPDSESLHEVVMDDDDDDDGNDDRDDLDTTSATSTASTVPIPAMIVMKLATSQRPLTNSKEFRTLTSSHNDDPSAMYRAWSERLDGLGWTKVLVDVREQVPSVSVWATTSRDSMSPTTGNTGNRRDTWTAQDLLREFGGGLLSTTTGGRRRGQTQWTSLLLAPPSLRLPLGHTVMIANAKDGINRWITKGGRPVMDYLGASMIRTLKKQKVPINNRSAIPTTSDEGHAVKIKTESN